MAWALHKALRSHVANTSGITSVIGSSPCRFYPTAASQNATSPYAVYRVTSHDYEYDLKAFKGIGTAHVSMTLHDDDDPTTIIALAETIRLTFQGLIGTLGSGSGNTVTCDWMQLNNLSEDYNPPVSGQSLGGFEIEMTWDVWYRLAIPSF